MKTVTIYFVVICLIILLDSVYFARGDTYVYKHERISTWPFSFDIGTLHCKENGNKKAIWLNGSDGYTYAINGQAMSWFERSGMKDGEGRLHRIARDYAHKSLGPIINEGLNLCR